jgi:antitoxin component YwqK of YwqJK toxin-antitoxin module
MKRSAVKPPKNGLHKEYYRDGALETIGRYLDGEKSGPWKYYLTNGHNYGPVAGSPRGK